MPARDKFHDVVRNALIKDGWIITDDPLTLKFGKTELYVDLGAKKSLPQKKKGRRSRLKSKVFSANPSSPKLRMPSGNL